jgi:hypothetical protein
MDPRIVIDKDGINHRPTDFFCIVFRRNHDAPIFHQIHNLVSVRPQVHDRIILVMKNGKKIGLCLATFNSADGGSFVILVPTLYSKRFHKENVSYVLSTLAPPQFDSRLY